MSDYTPTTERVRAAYSNYLAGLTRAEAKAELLALEFDRWLAEVKAQAWEECSDAYILKITGHSTNGGFLRLENPYRQGEEQ